MKKKIAVGIFIVIVVLAIGMTAYVNDCYHAKEAALRCVEEPTEGIRVIQQEDELIFMPENVAAGVIFYPGGKVQAESYAPLMSALAERGILAVLVRMPGNLAVLDIDAAEGLTAKYPDIEKWYMAGHSLGGSMAASYLGNTEEEFAGLILLAAYSTEDLADKGLSVLSIYGTQDGVLNAEKYESNKVNLPQDYSEVVIDGGCHAYFGVYGEQEGDGKATITVNEQIEITADAVADFINGGNL